MAVLSAGSDLWWCRWYWALCLEPLCSAVKPKEKLRRYRLVIRKCYCFIFKEPSTQSYLWPSSKSKKIQHGADKNCSEPIECMLTWQPDRRDLSGALDPQLHCCCTTGSCLDWRLRTDFSGDDCLQVEAGAFRATQSIIVGVSTAMNCLLSSPLKNSLFEWIIYRLLHVNYRTFPQDVVVMILRLTHSSKSFQIHCLSLGSKSSATMDAFSQCSQITSQEILKGSVKTASDLWCWRHFERRLGEAAAARLLGCVRGRGDVHSKTGTVTHITFTLWAGGTLHTVTSGMDQSSTTPHSYKTLCL